MAEVPSALPGFCTGASLAFGSGEQLADEDGGISPERSAIGLAARSGHQARAHLSAKRSRPGAGKSGVAFGRTALAWLRVGRAPNLGRHGAKETVSPVRQASPLLNSQ